MIKAKKFSYLVYRVDGSNYQIDSDEKPLKLKMLQDLVGGWIEVVRLSDEAIAIVDEDGIAKGKARNKEFPQFVGDVVLTRKENI